MDAAKVRELVTGMQFASDLRQQFETAGESSRARSRRPRRRRIAIAIAIGVAVALILGGVALATGFNPLRILWPTNEHGQTYGAGTALPWPDLVAVASDGKKGYCYEADLRGPSPTTRRAEDDLEMAAQRGYGIPKYESDGTTQIGVFWLGGPGGGGGGSWPNGRKEETTADAHGTIITTKKAANGTITVTRKSLDGGTTTDSAASDPSLMRLSKADRPVTWREITLWFRDVGPKHPELTSPAPVAPDWLVERMYAAARHAGDPKATAGWTLQLRRCAAPLEGSAAPASEAAKYTLVWMAVLHGHFTKWPASATEGPASGGFDWIYLLLGRQAHKVISEGASVAPFDTSMFTLQGHTDLGRD